MTTAEERTNPLSVDKHVDQLLVDWGGIGGGTTLLFYTQSWYAEGLQESLPLTTQIALLANHHWGVLLDNVGIYHSNIRGFRSLIREFAHLTAMDSDVETWNEI